MTYPENEDYINIDFEDGCNFKVTSNMELGFCYVGPGQVIMFTCGHGFQEYIIVGDQEVIDGL